MDELIYLLDSLRDIDSDTKAIMHILGNFENHLENEDRKDAKEYVQLFRMLAENLNERVCKTARQLDKCILDIENSQS